MQKWFYNNDEKKIWPFYSFKFLFFIFIFIHHCYNCVKIPFLRQPALAVSGFIIISGFLTGYIYINKDLKLKESISFSLKRVKKLYPLHLFMLFFVLSNAGLFNVTSFNVFFELLKRLLCNLFLIQSWINDSTYYFSFNGVTWFFSVYLFLSLITIPIMIELKKVSNKEKGSFLLVLLSVLIFCFTLLLVFIVRNNHLNEEFYLYIFPPVRMFEYTLGMIFGILSQKWKKDFKRDGLLFSCLEIISIVVLTLFVLFNTDILSFSNLLSSTLNVWILPLLFLLVIFSHQKGLISKALSFKPIVYFGEISMYAFLIHQPLITLFTKGESFIHYRYFALYLFILVLFISSIVNKYFNYKNDKRDSN